MKKLSLLIAAVVPGIFPAVNATVLVDESFTYADGNLDSQAAWSGVSGTGGALVSSNQASLGSGAQDVETLFTPQTGSVYFTIDLTVNTAPAGDDYGFGLRSSGGYNGGRFWMDGNGAGGYDFSVSTGNNTDILVTPALTVGTTYTIVGRYDADTDLASVWVDPGNGDEASPDATAGDTATASVDSFFIRQASAWDNGASAWTLDNLKVATTWNEVVPVPEPSTGVLAMMAALGLTVRRRK